MITIADPDFEIFVAKLPHPYAAVSDYLCHIKAYVYEFIYIPTNETIKFGESSALANTRRYRNRIRCGDRVYRQIENLPGWDLDPSSSSGMDMQYVVIPRFEAKFNVKVHKDQVKVRIWNLTEEAKDYHNPGDLTRSIESQLIAQYLDTHKDLPPGNIRGPIRPKLRVSNRLFESLYELYEM